MSINNKDAGRAENADNLSSKRLRFKVRNDLIYFYNGNNGKERLYISKELYKEVFKLAHN